MVLFRKKWFYSDNVVVFGQSGSLREKWNYWDESGCIRAKMVVFGKVVVFGKNDSTCAEAVVFGQSGFIWAKVVVIYQKWLYSGKSDCNRAK